MKEPAGNDRPVPDEVQPSVSRHMHTTERMVPVLIAEVPVEGHLQQLEDRPPIVASHLRRGLATVKDIRGVPARFPHAG
jgi:hypothetical protein